MLILLSNLLFASAVLAQNPFDIQFPVQELGNCASMQECKLYCDDSSNKDDCIRWAENNGFAPKRKHHKPEEVKAGPGGCDSRESCDAFCEKPENMNTCLDFAVKDGFMTKEEADKIKKFNRKHEKERQKRKVRKDKPRGPKEPKINEEKALKAIQEFGGPGGCSSFEACDEFCSESKNGETCMAFAVKYGLFDAKEAERVKKMMDMKGPGGCMGRECEDYCEKPENQQTCIEFAHEQGLMDDEEYQEVKKFMDATGGTGIGPGGCYNEGCEEYCDNPANQDECFEFFKNAGMIDPEEIEMIENMKRREMEMESKMHEEEMRYREEGMRYETEEQKRIWQEIEGAVEHQEDESLRKFYEEFPMDTEWTPESEEQKNRYWENVEQQRKIDEERQMQEQMEFEIHMREKEEMMQPIEQEFIEQEFIQEEFEPVQAPIKIEIKAMPELEVKPEPMPELTPTGIILQPFIKLFN